MTNDGVFPGGPLRWLLLPFQLTGYGWWLRVINLRSRQPVVGACDVDVSLASHGVRVHTVWKTIETIGRGVERPRRVILWLADEAAVKKPPRTLRRLVQRGLEIKHCGDFGPHSKYFPYVMASESTRTLVTADDDVYYPRNWLSRLVAAHRAGEVTAYRARIRSDEPYANWPMCTTSEPSDRVFATGVSGVAYPPELLSVLRSRGDAFLAVCPHADDVWLHFAAVASGIPVRQVSNVAANWWPQLGVAAGGLWAENVMHHANDLVIEPTCRAWLGTGTRYSPQG
ncbi:hypothetical protein BayCH28_26020 [Mycolicibacterium sp. CH28]|nr:hypothetical protein BayCH28_26020 [Mycolicibacterium sp. CH28]